MRGGNIAEYRILGPIEMTENGRARDLGGLRERTLLARLLLSAGHVVSAERLAEDLWDGEPPPQHMATLRVYVSRLRRGLGPESAALTTQPSGYRLTVADGALDADRFATLTAAASRDMATGQPASAAATLREALQLWRGPALFDVADFAFAQADVARLEEAKVAATEARIDADLACGRHTDLVGELEGLVAAHPLRERMCRQWMLALYRCGRQADALQVYQELRDRLAGELGIDPSPELQRLREGILRQEADLNWQPPSAFPDDQDRTGPDADAGARQSGSVAGSEIAWTPEAATGWLPAETTSFVGREAELATLDDLLGRSRLVTLTGPAGSGKTRIALQAASRVVGGYPGGVWLAELAPVAEADMVVQAVASVFAIREEPGRPLADTVAAHLRASEALLVIDNCEHVLEAAASLAALLLRNCPSLRILATSQCRLDLAGEANWPVPPMTLPEPAERDHEVIAAAESVRLLCDRARQCRPGFALTEANAAAVSEICRRLDGLPLALELAAARMNVLTAEQLTARLDDRFRLLAGGGRDGLARHRTLQTAIEWSHDLLSDAERVCFRRLAVFASGCTLEAAEAVLPDGVLPAEAVLEAITGLVGRSLLTVEERCGSMRYGMLESLHQFAKQQLVQAESVGERDALHHRHLAWLLRYAAGADLNGPDQEAWLDLLEAEQDNFLAGLEWSLHRLGGEPALELAGSLAPFWVIRGHTGLGRRWLDATLTAAGPQADPRLRARALDGAGQLSSVQADYDSQRACQQQSLSIWRQLGDDSRTSRCLGDLGAADHVLGEYRAARGKFTESLELARQAGDIQQVARSLSGLGRIAMHQNDLAQAQVYFAESVSRARQAGDLRLTTLVLGNHGVVAYNQGDFEVAKIRFTENLANATRLGDRKLMAGALTNLGGLAHATGDPDGAAGLHAQALALSEQIGDRRIAAVALTNLGLAALARGDQAAARRYHGRSLDLAVAIGEPRSIAENLEELAGVDTAAGLANRAVALYGAAQAIREAIASPVLGPDAVRIEQAAATLRHALGPDRYTAAQARGRAMTEDEAVALAREIPAPPPG